MKTRKILIMVGLSVCMSVLPVTLLATEDPLCNPICVTMREIRERSPNVVLIKVPGSSGEVTASGTGTVVSPEGGTFIITNNHVVEGSASGRVWVIFEDGKKAEVEIVGRDPAADLALLISPELPRGVTPVRFGDRLRIGQQVYAFGYPFGEPSVTFGFINAVEPTITWPFVWMQAPLNPGNSGGPLFNEKREMVGVNTAVIPTNIAIGGGISLVMPIDYVERLLARLTRERVVRHGVAGLNLDDSVRLLPLFFEKHGVRYPPRQHGVAVTSVIPGSPADRANIRAGDIILKWNGAVFPSARRLREKIFFDHRPGDDVTVTIQRDGQIFERSMRLIEYSPPKREG